MKKNKEYDYIIAGGGAAGLSLAYWILNGSLSGKNVLIFEPVSSVPFSKTWCFWATNPLPFRSAKKVFWNRISIVNETEKCLEFISPYSYFHAESHDFYEEILDLIEANSNIEIRYEQVISWGSNEHHAWVQTSEDLYQSFWLFNSLPLKPSSHFDNQRSTLQHFRGIKIRTSKSCFDPTCVELMDFRVKQIGNNPCFMYVLPFTSNEALVEFTCFSKEIFPANVYHQEISNYLNEHYQLKEWTVVKEEVGVIPMSTQTYMRREGERVLNIGTRGGLTKATTGYTFMAIQRDSQQIVQSLLAFGHPFSFKKKKKRYRFLDQILLGVINDEPWQIPTIMLKLFRNNSSSVLRFLDESSSWYEEIWIILHLPWPPFLRSLLKYLKHAFFIPPSQLHPDGNQYPHSDDKPTVAQLESSV